MREDKVQSNGSYLLPRFNKYILGVQSLANGPDSPDPPVHNLSRERKKRSLHQPDGRQFEQGWANRQLAL
eukprot:1140943-Pelagomonas_calceolata.AAC.7